MLVLNRTEGSRTFVRITHEKLKELAQSGKDVEMAFRVYNISVDGRRSKVDPVTKKPLGRVDVAFDDDARNFEIEREERLVNK